MGMQSGLLKSLLATISVLLLAGGSYAGYQFFKDDVSEPDLTLRTAFPKGYDRQPVEASTVAFQGQSQCTSLLEGIGNLVRGKEEPWTEHATAYTMQEPSAKEILAANPIGVAPYSYVGKAGPTWADLPTQLAAHSGPCEFRYEATPWHVRKDVANDEPVALRDAQGLHFLHARTTTKLGGNGDGQGGTRLLLLGKTTVPGLAVNFEAYEPGMMDYRGLLEAGLASARIEENGSFAVVFDIPAKNASEAELVLVPVLHEAEVVSAVAEGAVEFQNLFRLETVEAQVIPGAYEAITNPLAKRISKVGDATVYRGATLDEAFGKASAASPVKTLEAVGDTALLVQRAAEPDAPVKTTRIQQHTTRTVLMTTTRVEITEAGRAGTIETSYMWKVEKKTATFVVRQTSAAGLAEEGAKATAAVSKIAADGARVLQVAGEGPSAKVAVETASRLIDMKGQAVSLSEPVRATSGASLLRGADKYLLTAGALAAGWEWSEAMHTDDRLVQFIHQAKAIRIVAETVFSLNPTGAVLVAATNLGEYALQRLVPQPAWDAIADAANILFFGRASERDGKAAFEQVWPEITALAKQENATVLPFKMHKGNDVPFPSLLSVAALGLVLAYRRRRP